MNTRRRFTVRLETEKKCGRCHDPIRSIPADVDPKTVYYCMDCRRRIQRMALEEGLGADEWLGRGDPGGATVNLKINQILA